MKQLIIGKNKSYASSANYFDLTSVSEGAIGIFTPSDGLPLMSDISKVKENVAIVCGRGDNKMPIHFPEVDIKTLTIQKSEYQVGAKFSATITIPTVEKNKEYVIVVIKKGTVFNERNLWSFDAFAKSEDSAKVAEELVKRINTNNDNLGITAESSGANVIISGIEEGQDFEVLGAEGLMGVEVKSVTNGQKAILDKVYVQDLASRCAAGKGFNDTYIDGDSIYPGYPEVVEDEQYVLYTLRFAVPRVASKQRDEVVYQIVHIAVPITAPCVNTLDSIFQVSSTPSSNKLNILDMDCDPHENNLNEDEE